MRAPFIAGRRGPTRIDVSTSRVAWECSPKSGGKSHLKLNTGERPIANKYREGKMQRTLKRELKVLEIVKREAIGTSQCRRSNQSHRGGRLSFDEGSSGLRRADNRLFRGDALRPVACQRRLGRSRDGPAKGEQAAACCYSRRYSVSPFPDRGR